MEIVANFHEHDKHNAFMLILVTRVGQFRHFLLIQQVSMVFTSDHPCIEGIKCTLNTGVAWSEIRRKWWRPSNLGSFCWFGVCGETQPLFNKQHQLGKVCRAKVDFEKKQVLTKTNDVWDCICYQKYECTGFSSRSATTFTATFSWQTGLRMH